jgi:FlaA1/EpsC-like NDP-sugar epimerase
MRRKWLTVSLMGIDMLIVATVAYLSLAIRFEGKIPPGYGELVLKFLPFDIAIVIGFFWIFGLYRRLWQYASIGELLAIVGAVTGSSALILGYSQFFDPFLPRSVVIIAWFLMILSVGGSRLSIRVMKHLKCVSHNGQSRILIVGAGDTGATVAREIHQHHQESKRIVGFVDDAKSKRGRILLGYKILGSRHDLKRLVDQYQVDEIIISINSVTGEQLRGIVNDCRQTGRLVRMVPGTDVLYNGRSTVDQLREVDLEDLLRRPAVRQDLTQLARYLHDKRILVTGAGGSIGSELCRQISRLQPNSLTLLGKGENSIYEIYQELHTKYPDLHIEPVIADIRDQKRIRAVFNRIRPEVVFHAAAHKHVPLMELQPEEAVQNNIFGTKNVAEAAHAAGTGIFVMISTDKAVNPTSVMGTTKRVAEQVIQCINQTSRTRFVAVRFGNVLGSRGSVVPLFKKQIAVGGPVTVTHPEMQRYFMTIPEAVQLVLQAGTMARGGEVFVLDMGQPVKIYDMACTLIELAGLRPHQDIEIKFTGLRPGEKLFEELLSAEEGTSATAHEQIFAANLQAVDPKTLELGLALLQQSRFSEETKRILAKLVPTYTGYHEAQDAAQNEAMDEAASADVTIANNEKILTNLRELAANQGA